MTDRRVFRRIPGSALPWLTAFTARAPKLDLLDISSGGVLIATPTYWKPGERELFSLQGENLVKVVGWVVRAEVVQLAPTLTFQSAIRFAEPVSLNTLATRPDEPLVHGEASRELRDEFARVVRGLPDVQGVRLSSSIIAEPGRESVYFAVPDSTHGERRQLQVFFEPGTLPKTEQFTQLRQLAVLASGLPDFEMANELRRSLGRAPHEFCGQGSQS